MTRGWKILILAALAVLAILLAYHLRAIFMPLLVALLLAYILNPLLTLLEKRGVPRLASIVGLYAVLGLLLTALALTAVPAAFDQARSFVHDTFTGPEARIHELEPHLRRIGIEDWNQVITAAKEKIRGHEAQLMKAGGSVAAAVVSLMTGSVSGFIAVASFIALVPVYLFFLLKNLNPWWERVSGAIPAASRDRVLGTLRRIHAANASFFRGQLTISALEGLIVFAGLWILGVRFSLLFGLLYAVLSIVPFLGVVVGFTVVELFVLVDTGGFTTTFFLVAGLFVFIQVIEGAALQPLILGKETGLHPMAIILALLIAGELFGLFGMLIAIPIASTAKILVEDYVWPMFEEVSAGGGQSDSADAARSHQAGSPPTTGSARSTEPS